MQAIFKKKSSRSRTHQAGLTLVELSIALAISAVVVMSALIGIRKLIDSNNARAALTQMGSALANMSKTAQSLNDYSVYDDTLGMAKMGVFDSGALVKSATNAITQVRNSFGGYVWTRRNTATIDTLAANNGLWYVVTGVPNSACVDVVSGSNNTAISVYVTASGTAPMATPTTQYLGTTPINVNVAAIPKQSGGVMNPNNIESSCGASGSSIKDIYILTTI
jgi:prepilin-type N-terminal cleavage/methylation domain-containing protein